MELLTTNNKTVILSAVVVAMLPFANSYAEFDPAVIKAGGVDIVPTLGVSESYDSNILYGESTKQGDMITSLKPAVTATVESGANKYSLKTDAAIGSYSKSKADNYLDSSFSVDVHQSFTRKIVLDVKAKRENAHENRGSGYSQGANLTVTEPDRYSINQVDGEFAYGSRDAIGRIVFRIASGSRIYNNNRAISKDRDRDNASGGATFYYHVMPKTSLLAEFSQQSLVYRNNESYNSNEQRVLVGTRWDISALTSGTAKAGLLRKKFTDATRVDTSIFSWEIGARWSPLSYSVFDVVTKGTLDETNGGGNFIESKTLLIKWAHFWNKSIDTAVDVNVTNNKYQPTTRQDNFRSLGIKTNYNLRRWLDVAADYRYVINQSTLTGFDYDKNIFTFSLTAAL